MDVRLRRPIERALEVRFCAVRNRAVWNRNPRPPVEDPELGKRLLFYPA